MEMLLTGDLIDARTALDWGLVNRVVPAAGLDAAVARSPTRSRARAPPSVALGKRAFYEQVERGLAGAYATGGRDHGRATCSTPTRPKASTRSSASARRAGARR